ncbi:MAG: helix-turn-helix domain-containing protein [Planctomycetota bacterium]
MESRFDPAPALGRGLDLLRRLDDGGPATLESLTRATAWPKSSVLRLLGSLERAGGVERDPATRRYRNRLRLVPADGDAAVRTLAERLGPTMDRLCRDAGVTVELYAARTAGLTMIDRREPTEAEVCVRARVGHVRGLAELEALSQVVRAWPGTDAASPPLDVPACGLWAWDRGRRRRVNQAEAKRVVQRARRAGVGVDLGVNENGVRRYAAPLLTVERKREGVLALARVCPPTAVRPDPKLVRQLVDAVGDALRRS